jgi:hypothetical protein
MATFNRRAIFVFERAGFEPVVTFGATTRDGEWLLMSRGALG